MERPRQLHQLQEFRKCQICLCSQQFRSLSPQGHCHRHRQHSKWKQASFLTHWLVGNSALAHGEWPSSSSSSCSWKRGKEEIPGDTKEGIHQDTRIPIRYPDYKSTLYPVKRQDRHPIRYPAFYLYTSLKGTLYFIKTKIGI